MKKIFYHLKVNFQYPNLDRIRKELTFIIEKNIKDSELKLYSSDYECYFYNGKIHRDNAPALIIYKTELEEKETRVWFQNGKIHRIDAPACITPTNFIWYENDKKHRLGKPAEFLRIECDKADKNNWEYEKTEIIDGIEYIIPPDCQKWYFEGKLHRLGNPANIWYWCEEWYYNGKLHRLNGPASSSDYYYSRSWYINGKCHRVDEPAIISGYGNEWFHDNKLHRINGPAIDYKGCKLWYRKGKLHRLNAPAIIIPHAYFWFYEGKPHRLDGPAVFWGDEAGSRIIDNQIYITKPKEKIKYYINGMKIKKENYEEEVKKYKLKLMKKYFDKWYLSCDYYGTLIYKKNMENSIDSIMEMYEK